MNTFATLCSFVIVYLVVGSISYEMVRTGHYIFGALLALCLLTTKVNYGEHDPSDEIGNKPKMKRSTDILD